MTLPFAVSVERLRELHAVGLARWGGRDGEREPDCLEASVGLAETSLCYHQAEIDSAVIYACYLLRNIAGRHCMVDGNKRLAWAALCESLALLGLTVGAEWDEAGDFIEHRVVVGHCSVQEIVEWVAARIVALD